MIDQKSSILCIGLDPALQKQRNKNTIPSHYVNTLDENEARLSFCLDIIDHTGDFAVAAKPNEQYLFGLTKQQHQKLTSRIRNNGLLSIYDLYRGICAAQENENCELWKHPTLGEHVNTSYLGRYSCSMARTMFQR
jgi:hypothetical protein